MRRMLVIVALIGVVFSVSPGQSRVVAQEATPAACPATTAAENAALARRWFDDLWNPRNLSALDALASADLVYHWAVGTETTNAADFADRLQSVWTSLPTQYTTEFAVAGDDLVALRWVGRGTHAGEFLGVAATGKPVTFTGINIFRIECGKVAEVWAELDGLGLLKQLQGQPAPASIADGSPVATDGAIASPGACPATTEAENEAIAQAWHEEVINNRNPAVLTDILDPHAIHHAAGGYPEEMNPAGVTAMMNDFLTAFPDLQYHFDLWITQDDYVVERYTATGTQEGALGDLPASGRTATWTGINIFRIECGKIVEIWSEVDALSRLAQLTDPAAATPAP